MAPKKPTFIKFIDSQFYKEHKILKKEQRNIIDTLHLKRKEFSDSGKVIFLEW